MERIEAYYFCWVINSWEWVSKEIFDLWRGQKVIFYDWKNPIDTIETPAYRGPHEKQSTHQDHPVLQSPASQ